MWYFVEKNGKAIAARRSEAGALDYAKSRVSFDSKKDTLRVVSDCGEIILDW